MTEIIRLASEELEIEVWTLGARLNGVWFQGIGSLVDGAESEDEARGAKKYNGAVVGPVANRIAGGRAQIDDRLCRFEMNDGGKTTLHSGARGVHSHDWLVFDATKDRLILNLSLADGVGGFPGNRTLSAEYVLRGNELHVNFTASSDAPTWMNLALHPYWRFGESGRAGARLSVNAEFYLPVDADKIPTGERSNVTDTVFDLREIGVPSPDTDHNFCLKPMMSGPSARIEGDLGVGMEVSTTAPGLQVYSGKKTGIALEPQHWPNAMHQPSFPSIVLRPGQTYQQSTTYRFMKL